MLPLSYFATVYDDLGVSGFLVQIPFQYYVLLHLEIYELTPLSPPVPKGQLLIGAYCDHIIKEEDDFRCLQHKSSLGSENLVLSSSPGKQ